MTLVITIETHISLTQLEVLLTCQAINLGRSWWTVSSIIATMANFYLTTWEEFHTGAGLHITSLLLLC